MGLRSQLHEDTLIGTGGCLELRRQATVSSAFATSCRQGGSAQAGGPADQLRRALFVRAVAGALRGSSGQACLG